MTRTRAALAALLMLVVAMLSVALPNTASASPPTQGITQAIAVPMAYQCNPWATPCGNLGNGSYGVGIGVARGDNTYGYDAVLPPQWWTLRDFGWPDVDWYWIGSGFCADVYRKLDYGLQQPWRYHERVFHGWHNVDDRYDYLVYPRSTDCGSW